jgi:hypothetical protein
MDNGHEILLFIDCCYYSPQGEKFDRFGPWLPNFSADENHIGHRPVFDKEVIFYS